MHAHYVYIRFQNHHKCINIIKKMKKFFELKSKEYRDGIKRKKQDRNGV